MTIESISSLIFMYTCFQNINKIKYNNLLDINFFCTHIETSNDWCVVYLMNNVGADLSYI